MLSSILFCLEAVSCSFSAVTGLMSSVSVFLAKHSERFPEENTLCKFCHIFYCNRTFRSTLTLRRPCRACSLLYTLDYNTDSNITGSQLSHNFVIRNFLMCDSQRQCYKGISLYACVCLCMYAFIHVYTYGCAGRYLCMYVWVCV